jgi:hypothetical protein
MFEELKSRYPSRRPRRCKSLCFTGDPARPPEKLQGAYTESPSENRSVECLICKGLWPARILYRKQLIVVRN